jgi:two-component system, LytTR family, response regulator
MPNNSPVRVLIADDEPLARRGIRQLLATHPDMAVVGEARNGREALRLLESIEPDLLFLDVQMPELDGFGVLREHGAGRMPAVIFVTAHDEFAVKAFEAHAIDYLVKPLERARFADAVERVREQMRSAAAVELSRRLSALLSSREQASLTAPAGPRRLLVPTATGRVLLDLGDIGWIEADDYYSAIHAHGRRYLIRRSLASLERGLRVAHFVRAHRRALVNLERVREVRTHDGEMMLILMDGARIPVSRRRREQIARLLRELQA